MRLRLIALAVAHRCATAAQFGGCDARMEATSIPEADLRGGPEARAILEVRACATGVNAESAI